MYIYIYMYKLHITYYKLHNTYIKYIMVHIYKFKDFDVRH